jgi:histidine ammonia-lyase
MGWGAGRKLEQLLANTVWILAVELLCAAQGIEYRAELPAAATGAVVAAIRGVVPHLDDDREVGREIEAVARLIESGTLERAANQVVPGLE